MGLFGHPRDENKEREDVQRHSDAQHRLEDARRHQQERHQTSLSSSAPGSASHSTSGRMTPGANPLSGYPEGSWRKQFDLYVVKKGDSLFRIARQVYGDGNVWHRIQQANPIVLKNPDLIHPGLILRIPKGEGTPLA